MQVAAAPAGTQLPREDHPAHVPEPAAPLPEEQHPESGAYGEYNNISPIASITCCNGLLLFCQVSAMQG